MLELVVYLTAANVGPEAFAEAWEEDVNALAPQDPVAKRHIQLFEGKGDAHLGRDWPNILRFHTLLGTIFERRGQWGPSDSPRSALFQWERALEAQTRMLAQGYEPIAATPGLHESIARAYRELDQPDQAWQHYTDAAEGFLGLRNP